MLRISAGRRRAAEPVRDLGVELGDLAGPEHQVLVAEDEPDVAGQDVDPLVAVVGARLGVTLLVGMTIFQACMPSGCRVSGMTVLPLTRPGLSRMRGSPTSGAPTRSSSGTR